MSDALGTAVAAANETAKVRMVLTPIGLGISPLACEAGNLSDDT